MGWLLEELSFDAAGENLKRFQKSVKRFLENTR